MYTAFAKVRIMADSGKQDGEKYHPIRWNPVDWERIEKAAEVLTRTEHVEHSPTDVIRKGTRGLLESLLGPAETPASAA